MKRSPGAVFGALCIAGAALVAAYLLYVWKRVPPPPTPVSISTALPDSVPEIAPAAANAAVPTAPATSTPTAPPRDTAEGRPRVARRVFFRHNGVDSHYGQVAWVDLAHTDKPHFVESLQCEVVYVAGGRGICLSADRGVFTTYTARLFDARTFAVTGSFPLKGIPSRARVSIDGTLAASTVFVSGHGYTTLDFSTQTLLIDTRTGIALADLETFEVRQDGVVLKNSDFNFWGVTFTADASRFYATLSTGGNHWLIKGNIAARSAEVIHENVECPSLSPDGRHIAYKKRLHDGDRILWQLHVLELASGREIALAEKRSIDDQLEWLDDRTVLYSVPSADDGSSPSTDVWMASLDAAATPRRFLSNAYSPASARCKIAADCAAAN